MGKKFDSKSNPYVMLLISIIVTVILIICVFFGIILFNIDKINHYEERCEYFKEVNAEIERADVVFIGDTVVENCTLPELNSHNNFGICNRGIKDDTTLGVKNRLQESVYDVAPRIVVIMVGASDIALPTTINAIMKTYKEIVYDIFDNIPTTSIYLVSVIPQNKDHNGNVDGNMKRIKELNSKIEEFSKTCAAAYINAYDLFIDDTGYLDTRYSDDGFNLNNEGYLVLKELFKKYGI